MNETKHSIRIDFNAFNAEINKDTGKEIFSEGDIIEEAIRQLQAGGLDIVYRYCDYENEISINDEFVVISLGGLSETSNDTLKYAFKVIADELNHASDKAVYVQLAGGIWTFEAQ